jgi:formylglycine-generating enzyme required for sulfatase activity
MSYQYRTREEEQESARKVMAFLFPKGASGWAIATGVSVVLIELLIGIPFLLPFGILALRDIKKHPEKTGKGVAWLGVILGSLVCIIVICVLVTCLGSAWEERREEKKIQERQREEQEMAELLAQGDVQAVNEKLQAEEEQKAGDTKSITLPGGAVMEMVWCPLGVAKTDAGMLTVDEGFWMAKTEVTQAQWKSVMGENPSLHTGDDNLPVENVSWEDCKTFCKESKMQLPTEEQWEYACRAGSTGDYGGSGQLEEMGWFKDNAGSQTHPAGQKGANAWGLQDMHGNVWEWCEDLHSKEGDSGEKRVLRGGCAWNAPLDCRSEARTWGYRDFRYGSFGFRPVTH